MLFLSCNTGDSDGKDSACNAGDPDSVPGWEDALEKETVTHSIVLAWRMDRGAWQAIVRGVARVGQDLATKPPPPPVFLPGEWTEEPGRLQSVGSQGSDTT